ncbi:chemotaxis protein CheA [Chryseolinea sp. T2]|uniref:chemotaxis protein CheA n=1 Tax=Chryseolinea sp. T2 TaxID=3129255 RepID=UPI003076F6DF
MEEYIQEFKAEAASIIQRLQEQILLLEQSKENKGLVEEIFRSVHTLKGSSRMFGFEQIERITHELETTFDSIREGKAVATRPVIELALSVADMSAAILSGQYDQQEYNALLEKLSSEETLTVEPESKKGGVYQVLYFPKENIYERGVNPLAPLNELKELGDQSVFVLRQPRSLEEQEADKKFESIFEIIINMSGERALLEDVFLFMETDEFSIDVLEPHNQNWQQAIDRAQRLSGGTFSNDLVKEHLDVMSKLFKNNKADAVTENASTSPPAEPAEAVVRTQESAMNFINVKLERLDEMMKLVSELVTIKAELHYRASILGDIELSNTVERLEKVTTRFRDNAFSMRLVPLQILSLKFQRMVRDLAGALGKEINLMTDGLDTEIDKTIITEIEAPIMHIIRNAIDHGLETVDERRRCNKSDKGLLKVVAFYAGANVFIQIQDDGRGLNLKRIREKAINKGIISANDKLTDQEIINLIFEPGFSTHDKATEYSGRGVGMDVVRQKLKDLRGSIEITTEEGLGTAFTIRLPLSLSILDVLHVKVKGINYLLPHNEVDMCISERLNADILQKRGHNVKYKGRFIPNLSLGTIFEMAKTVDGEPCTIIVNKNDQFVSVEVDEIIGEEQLVIKPVDEALKSLEYLSGVAVLGNGELAFLIDAIKLKDSIAV